MHISEFQIEVQNRHGGTGPGEPSQRPQYSVIHQKRETVLKSRRCFQPISEDERHAETRYKMCAKCEEGRALKANQFSSTTNRKERLLHSVRSCSSVSHPSYEISPRGGAPDKSRRVMTDAGITAMRSAQESAT